MLTNPLHFFENDSDQPNDDCYIVLDAEGIYVCSTDSEYMAKRIIDALEKTNLES